MTARRRTVPSVIVEGDDGNLWAVSAQQARGIRPAEIIALPAPRQDVAGLFPHPDGPVPVSTRLARKGEAVLLVEHGGVTAALLVRSVLAVRALPPPDAPPRGQQVAFAAGTTAYDGRTVLVLDLSPLLEELRE